MKTLKSFAVFFFLFAFVCVSYSQGKKSTFIVTIPLDENSFPLPCIGPFSGELIMKMTFFAENFDWNAPVPAKVLNKASGTITDLEGNEYTIESLFNCQLFVRSISASGNSNQSWTFRVRSADTGKLVATVHTTWHYEDFNGEGSASLINAQTVCH